MIDEAEAEKLYQANRWRRIAAMSVASVATIAAVILYCKTSGASSLAQPALATLIALALVSGLRTLDGPDPRLPVPRRAVPPAFKGDLVKLWLGCFLALEAAFLLEDLTTKLERSAPKAKVGPPDVGFSGRLIFFDADGRHEVTVSGRGVVQPTDEKANGPLGQASSVTPEVD